MRQVRVSVQKLHERAHLAISLAFLVACALFLISQVLAVNNSAYAFTLSFGRGYGITFHCDSYYKLPKYLQESMDVHEKQHLEDGTFWNRNEGEVRAYQAQLSDLRLRIVETKRQLESGVSPQLRHKLYFLQLFEEDTLRLLKEFKAKSHD